MGFLTPEEAAAELSVSKQTLANWRSTGMFDLPFTKIGKRVRYRRSDLEAWLTKRTATSTEAVS